MFRSVELAVTDMNTKESEISHIFTAIVHIHIRNGAKKDEQNGKEDK